MPALQVNNWTVSVDKASMATHEMISSDRAYDGTQKLIQTGAHAIKREWVVETAPLVYADARALEGMLQCIGEYWPFDIDVYSSKGLWPVSTSYGGSIVTSSPTPKFGGGCLYCAGPVTNLLTSNQATGGDTSANTTGFTLCDSGAYGNTVAGSTPAGTLTAYNGGSPAALQGSYSIRAILGTAGVLDFYGVRTTAVSVSALTTYTFSVYVRGYNGNSAVGQLYVVDQGNHQLASTTATSISSSVWTRMTLSFTTLVGTTAVELRWIEFNDAQYQVVFDQWQLETGGAASNWVNGSNPGLSLYYDVSRITKLNPGAFTLNCWTYDAYAGMMFALGSSADSSKLRFGYNVSHFLVETLSSAGSSLFSNSSFGSLSYANNVWVMSTLVCYQNPPPGMSNFNAYLNGVLKAQANGAFPSIAGLDRLYIGNNAGGQQLGPSGFGGSFLDEAMFVPYAMSAGMIAALANSATQFGQQPQLMINGDLIPGSNQSGNPVAAFAHDVTSPFDEMGDGAGNWTNNRGRVKFGLSEF